MQTVPSLIGTGTAVAAAATGLVFGQALDPQSTPANRPPSHSTSASHTFEPRSNHRAYPVSLSRPGTSSLAPSALTQDSQYHTIANPPVVSRPPLSRYQRPRTAQVTSPKYLKRRPSQSRQGEPSVFATISETPRASISSNGSWIKRLSIRPLSQHGSERSSIGFDSSSIAAFSHGSGAPILPQSRSLYPPPTPNKLVKRTTSVADESLAPSRRRANSGLLTLRRPATSHQRSATLHNLERDLPYISSRTSIQSETEYDQALLPSALKQAEPPKTVRKTWGSFFHSQTTGSGGTLNRLRESTPPTQASSPKRILPKRPRYQPRVHLVTPAMVSPPPSSSFQDNSFVSSEVAVQSPDSRQLPNSSVDNTPASKKTRRSISMTFSSAGDLMSRASGSLRRSKRGSTPKKESMRHVSDPVFGSPTVVGRRAKTASEKDSAPNPYLYSAKMGAISGTKGNSPSTSRTRNTSFQSSPPAVPFMSFQADSPQLGSAGGASGQHPLEENQRLGSRANSTSVPHQSRQDRQHLEQWFSMDGSDGDQRDFQSGDEDDTDFKSDTMFDSFRTAASGRVRSVETPLDSLYDGSPPSTTSNGKSKRLSIQEILSREWSPSNRIVEEEAKTPVPVTRTLDDIPAIQDHPEPRFSTDSVGRDLGRFSLDDDFDEDWTRDDDVPHHALSPPSKGNSLNSRGMNPNVRLALANISGNGVQDTTWGDSRNERPQSNLFDWSEPSVQERTDTGKPGLRPRTAYNNQEVDARSGRSSVRKGPTPTHVRSQSVPVVHDGPEESRPAGSKFGTWGNGTKPISEDWDEDFEFGGSNGTDNSEDEMFAVPERIQATQPSVKAHSGQIRELSLLVNDLQRLCRHAREMDLLDGRHRSLWKEAEGIIALASPDDDSLEADHESTSSIDLDAFEIHDRAMEAEIDTAELDKLDAALDGHQPVMSKTAVIRDRPSPRRRSVFSPDDDIFGVPSLPEDQVLPPKQTRPRTPEPRFNNPNDVNGVVRTVVEAMQHNSAQETRAEQASKKMHFDTHSLKVLVKRAGDLRDVLSDAVRRADQITNSPAGTPRRERHLDSSPAFTKVFDDPASSPPRRITKSRGNTLADEQSPQNSPSSALARRIRLMAV